MTIKHYRRRGTFMAVQFLGVENIDEVTELAGSRVFYSYSKGMYVAFIHGQEFPLRVGDYITLERDEYNVWSQDVFETLYEEAT